MDAAIKLLAAAVLLFGGCGDCLSNPDACKGQCRDFGRCKIVKVGAAILCEANSDEDCRRSGGCKRTGACHLDGKECSATTDADCKQSDKCKADGNCTLVIVSRDSKGCRPSGSDCDRSKRCTGMGWCRISDDGYCVK